MAPLRALLFWVNWRSLHLDPLTRTTPATLVGTLRAAEPRRMRGWQLLAGLALLLALRSLLYWWLGRAAEWQPKLDLGVIVLRMRSDILLSAFVYSLLSFFHILLIFYFWLLTLAALNHSDPDPDALQKLLRLHLGRTARWPWPLQILLPVLLAAILWMALHPLLVHVGTVTRVQSWAHLVEQGLLVGVSLVFTLKYVLPFFLFLHLLTSYVYLGSNPLWDFISHTSKRLLAPLAWLRFGKLDLAPLAGIILIFVLLYGLPLLILKEVSRRNLVFWPL